MTTETDVPTLEYLTVSDFAERAGVSKQAVYDRIKRDLRKFVREVDGRKMIDVAALSCVGKQSIPMEQPVKPIEQVVNQDSSRESSNQSTLLDYLTTENERLRTEIECLHSKIAEKDALIADKDRIIASYAERFASQVEQAQLIAKQALDTAGQAQLLQAVNVLDTDLEQDRTPWQRLIERFRRK